MLPKCSNSETTLFFGNGAAVGRRGMSRKALADPLEAHPGRGSLDSVVIEPVVSVAHVLERCTCCTEPCDIVIHGARGHGLIVGARQHQHRARDGTRQAVALAKCLDRRILLPPGLDARATREIEEESHVGLDAVIARLVEALDGSRCENLVDPE